jgi:hypothetical protein
MAGKSAFASRSQLTHINHSTACALRMLSAVAEMVPGWGRRDIHRSMFCFCSLGKEKFLIRFREGARGGDAGKMPPATGDAWRLLGVADLTFRKSEAVFGAIGYHCRLPALPIHDALIIPRSAEASARGGLSDFVIMCY